MPQGLQVITPGLFLAQVRIDAHVASRAGEAFVLPVWNVFVGVRVNVFFGKAEVDNVDDFVLFRRGASYQEILGFDISAKKRQNDIIMIVCWIWGSCDEKNIIICQFWPQQS